jgi:transcription-repair coupling factor (superfamily II helicase)
VHQEFLGRDPEWYDEQIRALEEKPLDVPGIREKTLLLEVGTRASLPELLRRLDELGYEKVLHVGRYGEFAHRGGLIDIFPVNTEQPLRIEFDGSTVSLIEPLAVESDLPRTEWEKITKRTLEKPISAVAPGDYLVHLDHGIGKFKEFTTLAIDGEDLEYYVLEYQKGDTLYVPKMLSRRKLSRYVGLESPAVSRLGGVTWLSTKRRAREDARKFAEELLKLYAERSTVTRPRLTSHRAALEEFIASFPYEETPDQVRAWEDVLRDMTHMHEPMDRLLAGDVGFGKTEIALRAAVLAVANGKQVAFLAPTTVLAHQHADTARERLAAIDVETVLLSRLVPKKEQEAAVARIADGSADIAIGTHRLLSKDITFKNLGLVIVDEEQRFGVKQKEHLKQLRAAVDVLSLSATPIPRTLAQSLAAIRPVSRLQVAPPGRKDIVTHFGNWDAPLVAEALRREVQRGGQAYVLHNRVRSIATFTQELRQLAPELRYGIVHGQLTEHALVDVMQQLRGHEIDVLVATTIIENGIDLANVNTLIVEETGKLGLAQAYQLRGRIGRGSAQGYAYFFWRAEPEGKALLRIDALRDADKLGAGWDVAMRDLEIRGAGNLLGRDQSGTVNRVGFNLYTQLLAEAVESLRRETKLAQSGNVA